MVIRWKEPPPDSRVTRLSQSQMIADQLRSRPGEWALVKEAARSSGATAIANATSKAYRPRGSFEAVARKRDDGTWDTYARYVGEPQP